MIRAWRSVIVLTKIIYYYARGLGILPWYYEWRTGRVGTSPTVTIYTIFANVSICCALPLLYDRNMGAEVQANKHALHTTVYMFMFGLRFTALIFMVAVNWRKRQEFVDVIRSFQALYERTLKTFRVPESIQRKFNVGIIRKFLCMVTADALLSCMGMHMLRHALHWTLAIRGGMLQAVFGLLNASYYQMFLALAGLKMYFQVLNIELNVALNRMLSDERYDQLAEMRLLVATHFELCKLSGRINNLFQWQCLCMFFNMYLFNLYAIYLVYTKFIRNEPLVDITAVGWAIFYCYLIAYTYDVKLSTSVFLGLLKSSQSFCAAIKTSNTLRIPGDAKKLSPMQKHLQMAALQTYIDPIKFKLLGLFDCDISLMFMMGASTVSHSIVLMQYDYKSY